MSKSSTDDAVARSIDAIKNGRIRLGLTNAARAIEVGEQHPILYRLRGALYESEGKLSLAVADFQTALNFDPHDDSTLNGLGLCLARMGDYDEAILYLKRAIGINPRFAHAQLNLGWALENIGDILGAKAAYEKTLQIDPSVAQAHSALAMLATRRGDWIEATRRGEIALANDPRQTTAKLALAITAVYQGPPHIAEVKLNALINGELAAPSNERSLALAALGDFHDKQKKYKDAFAYYTASKEVMKTFIPTYENRGYNIYSISDNIISYYSHASPPGDLARKSSRSRVVFLLGFPRTGTTLLGQILNSHPQVITLEESERLSEAAEAFLLPSNGLSLLSMASDDDLDAFRSYYWDKVKKAIGKDRHSVIVDKMPTNTLALPLISRLFPDSMIIYMERDPRDILLSCLKQTFILNPATIELISMERSSRFLLLNLRVKEIMKKQFGPMFYIQRYENLVYNFEKEINKLCAAIGIDKAPISNLLFGLDNSSIATPSARQISKHLNSDSIGRWRDYAIELAPFLTDINVIAQEMGYK